MADYESRHVKVDVVNSSSVLAPGAAYRVVVYEVGAIVATAATGTTITVDAGHGFATNDYLILNPGSAATAGYDAFVKVTGTTATTLTLESSITVAVGDVLFNLGTDSATGNLPQFDGSGVTIYSDMDGGTAITNSILTCDTNGNARYWTLTKDKWELVLDSALKPVGYELRSETDSLVPAYGSLHRFGDDTVSVTAAYAKVPFDSSGPALNISHLLASDSMLVDTEYAGTYQITATGSFETDDSDGVRNYLFAIFINELAPASGTTSKRVEVEAASDGVRYQFQVQTLAVLSATDQISLRVARTAGSADATLTFGSCSIVAHRVA